jgi:pimeloyl-ACP methyl ester carboxylesterase
MKTLRFAAGVLLFATAGAAPAQETEGEARPGIVFLVGGVGGHDPMTHFAPTVFPMAGVPHDIHDFRWTHGGANAFFRDLQDAPYMQRKADELAAEVRRLKESDPSRPIYLIGRSGGAGVVLTAARQLPPGALERIILLAAAVAPDHDLSAALQASKGGIVSFWSPLDWFVLSWGTRHFGTEDRRYTVSAGFQGFTAPDPADAARTALYSRLVEIRWSPAMIWEGNPGGHLGTAMPVFLAHEVAPWLMPEQRTATDGR